MNSSQRCRFLVVLLPLAVAACAHRHHETAATDPPIGRIPVTSGASGQVAKRDQGPESRDGKQRERPTLVLWPSTLNPRPFEGPGFKVQGRKAAGTANSRPLALNPQASTLNPSREEPNDPPFASAKAIVLAGFADNAGDGKAGEKPETKAESGEPKAGPNGGPPAKVGVPKSSLTLANLEQMAFESNPSLMQLAAVVEKTRGIRVQSGLYPNPVVGYSGSEIGNDGRAGQQGGFISQTIVTGNKLKLNRDVASWNIQEMCWEYQAQRLRVKNDVHLRYYEVLGAQKRLKIAAQLLKVAERGVSITEELFKVKQASRADVLQAKVDRSEIRIIQRNAKYEYEAAWKRLTAVLGRSRMQPAALTGEITGPTQPRSWEPTYEKLIAASPQLEALRSRVQGARLAIGRQEAQPIPNLLTQVGVQHDYDSKDTIASVQVGVPLPLFNRNQGNIQTAHAEYQRAIRDTQRLELQLRDRLALAFRGYQQANYQVDEYEKNILPNARESLRLIEATYKAGQVSFLRVLTARRTFFEANLRYVKSLIELRKAGVVIDGFVLTGGLTDVPNIGNRSLSTAGQRGQALSGQ